MSSQNTRNPRREMVFAAIFWLVVLVTVTIAASAVGLAKRGLPLAGWSGTQEYQVVGWTLVTLPYVLVAWLPVALIAVGATALLNLSRRTWVAMSLVLALGLLALFGAFA